MTDIPTQTQGRVLAVLGPTNTGKTHYAIERLMGHASGMIGLPLRLLAREVYDRVVSIKGAASVALITGEEKIVPRHPQYWVTTVESMPLDVSVECLAVDEIQLCADADRGHVFTHRLLHARGNHETLFLGSDTMRPLIQKLVPHAQFISRPRFSDLAYTGARKLTRLPRRSAIIAFSAQSVYEIAELVRRQRGGAAVVLGALSPRTRNAQVALYQSGDVDFMVATDAIGMGLNMDVDHVAFAETEKFDGTIRRPLRPQELAQIAGRAGRHMNDGTFGVTGDAVPFEQDTVESIENHRFDPVRVAQWRNHELDFTTLRHLQASLETMPPVRGLTRTRSADDASVLKLVSEMPVVRDMTLAGAALKQLWEVCQIPDFRKVTIDEHAQLCTNIYLHLMSHEGVLPADWIEGHIARLDNKEGEIDAVAARIAHIRTWTYVANRPGWLTDPEHWQGRAREVEDKLSDTLHELLTQRFVDRRTSVLMRALREDEEFVAQVDDDGEVLVEGEYVGRLQGFSFVPDPRALGVHGRALRAAALKGLASEIADRAHKLSIAPEAAITLSEHGRLWWNGGIVGRLVKGAEPLTPRVELLADDLLSTGGRERALYRLQGWVNGHIDKVLAPLMALKEALKELPKPAITPVELAVEAAAPEPAPEAETPAPEAEAAAEDAAPAEDVAAEEPHDEHDAAADAAAEATAEAETAPSADAPSTDAPAKGEKPKKKETPAELKPLNGQARGLAFMLIESLGAVSRAKAGGQLKGLSQDGRAPLRRLGVRFGQYSVFLPALIKPQGARLKALLWAVHQGLAEIPPPPQAGLTSIAVDAAPPAFLEAAGYRVCGQRAVRFDMLERLADLIRAKGQKGQMPDVFEATGEMMSILGAGAEELAVVLRGLGFREAQTQKEDGTTVTQWKARDFASERKAREEREAQRKAFQERRKAAKEREKARAEQAAKAPSTENRPPRGDRPDRDRPRRDFDKPREPRADAAAPASPAPEKKPDRKPEKKHPGGAFGRDKNSGFSMGGPNDRKGGDRDRGRGRDTEPKVFSTERPKGPKGSREPDPNSPFAILAQLKGKS
jgi:superfamily II DNA/RNA helicase